MAVPLFGGNTPPTAAFFQQPAAGYVGSSVSVPLPGCSAPTYTSSMGYAGSPYVSGSTMGYAGTPCMSAAYYPPAAGFPAMPTAAVPQYSPGLPQSYVAGYPAGAGGYASIGGFGVTPTIQSFAGPGFYGCGAPAVEAYPYAPVMGVHDPLYAAAAYADYDEDFDVDPAMMKGGFRGSQYSGYGQGGHYGHGRGRGAYHGAHDNNFFGGSRGRGSRGRQGGFDQYDDPGGYDPGRGRYVQHRKKAACC